MEFIDVINERYSVRGYLDKPVEKEKLEYVLKAATIAPTGVNAQAFKVYVIDTKKHKEDLSKIYGAKWFVEAPYVLCVVGIKNEAWTRPWDMKNIADIDATIVMDHSHDQVHPAPGNHGETGPGAGHPGRLSAHGQLVRLSRSACSLGQTPAGNLHGQEPAQGVLPARGAMADLGPGIRQAEKAARSGAHPGQHGGRDEEGAEGENRLRSPPPQAPVAGHPVDPDRPRRRGDCPHLRQTVGHRSVLQDAETPPQP